MQSWQSVVVNDDTLEAHGRAGRVTSGGPFKGAGKHKDVDYVDVMLDADEKREAESITIACSSLRAL